MTRMARVWGSTCLVLFALVGVAPRATPPASAERRLISADEDSCRLIAARTASPVGIGGCSGVRPGAFFTSPIGGCSFNFLFRGTDGHRYIATAGHCLLEEDGKEKKWAPGKGPVIQAGGRTVGRAAYAILKDESDFGLIRLNSSATASPQMCHFGGPTGLDTARSSGPVLLEHYGNGLAVSTVTPARTSLALNTLDPEVVTAIGLAAFGDSGSGATRNGRALGVLVAVGLTTEGVGDIFITRLAPQVARAQAVLRTTLRLQTAPRL